MVAVVFCLGFLQVTYTEPQGLLVTSCSLFHVLKKIILRVHGGAGEMTQPVKCLSNKQEDLS